ncbi:MAG: CinA family nicotinamide mononucleotide deamidase-related protein [Anaerolineae bacterium]
MSGALSAEIIASGTELLLGDLVDTNSAYIARQLRDLGINVFFHTTVGDNAARMQSAVEIALGRANLIITTGGLGPTVDDIAREAIAAAVGQPLVFSEELLGQIAERFARFGRPMAENNRRQAFIPEKAIAIPNPVGTAPCFRVEKDGGIIISLPGVPAEMKYLMENAVIPYLRQLVGSGVILSRILHVAGIGESQVDALIADMETGSNPTVGLSAHPGQTDVRITAKAETREQAEGLIAPVEAAIHGNLSGYVYGADAERLANVVAAQLGRRALAIAVVETITDGLIAQELSEAGATLVWRGTEPCTEVATEAAALERARQLLRDSGATIALASLANQCSADDVPGARRAAIAIVVAAGSTGTAAEWTSSIGFGSHPGLFQPWVLNYTLYTLWDGLGS